MDNSGLPILMISPAKGDSGGEWGAAQFDQKKTPIAIWCSLCLP